MRFSSISFLAAITPSGGGGGGSPVYLGETFTEGSGTIVATLPSGLSAADTVTAIAFSDNAAEPSTMSAPSGWTAGTGVTTTAEGMGGRYFTAAGNVSDLTFTATGLIGVLIFATSAPLRNAVIEGTDYGSAVSGANRPNPAVTAVSGDLVVSAYIQVDDGVSGALNSPGSPQAGYTRELLKNDLAPWISVLSLAGAAGGSTGAISHDANGGFSSRFQFSGSYGI